MGLTSEQAASLLRTHAANEFAPARRLNVPRELLRLFVNPLTLVLLFSVAITAWLGEWTNAGIILAMVLLSGGLNFFQTFRSWRAVERLREPEVPTATVERDGVWQPVPRRELVPGDRIRLTAGDRVPADARLAETEHLHVEEAALTGESLPVEKRADGANVFAGTSVVSGTAVAEVTATGRATQFGQLAERLRVEHPATDFERGLARFSGMITRAIFVLVVFVFATSALAGRPVLDSLLFAVALAVGLTPEFLPVISTVILGRGAVHMARHQVIVKNLAAIQNLGAVDVLCSDKTGTLTTGVMSLERSVDATGAPDSRVTVLAWINARLHGGRGNPLDNAILRARPAGPGPEKAA